MHAVSPSSRVSNAAKIVRETAAILQTIDEKSRDRVLTVLVMAKAKHRGMSLEKALSYRRLPSNRFMFGPR
jgi:hypothetical protein